MSLSTCHLKKGASSISDYFQKAQTIAHTLAAIHTPLRESKLVSYVLAGLGSDYDPLITSITTRIDPVSLEELYGRLLTHEQRLDHANSASDLAVSNVNIAQKNNLTTGRPPRPFSATSRQQTVSSFSNHGRGCRGRGRDRGSFNHSSSLRPTCQVCLKPGHTAAKCYHRFDHAYQVEPALPSVY
jgi:hypothetical protein